MSLAPRFVGSLSALARDALQPLFARGGSADSRIALRTAEIIARVREERDAGLRALAQELDGVSLSQLEVPLEACQEALASLAAPLRQSLERAHANITRVHRAMRPSALELEVEPGVRVGRRPDPLARVGVYAPGGRAAYPSSVLMGVCPAKEAGVPEIVLCTPPGSSGAPSTVVLAAAALAGVHRVFAVGGAGAIAAMAYGTETIPRVDRIVGPGNAYVTEAKLQVMRVVGIDSPAGPSELLLIADSSASAEVIARELIAQAEHDPDAAVVALIASQALCDAVLAALGSSTPARLDVVRTALERRGALLTVRSLDEAFTFCEAFAPEHLLLCVSDLTSALARARNAGAVFVGPSASVAFGDYLTGANHVLPTAGLARCFSGLSTLDFYRYTSWQSVTPEAAARLAPDTARLAEAEGLPGHAEAARAWERTARQP